MGTASSRVCTGTREAPPAHGAAPGPAWSAPWEPICLAAILLLYGLLLLSRYAPGTFQLDDNGYLAQGSLMFTTGRTWFTAQSDAQFIGIHWLLTPSGTYISRYPPGLALLYGLVYVLAGYKAATLVNPALALLTLAGLHLLARRLALSAGWVLLAVVFLAAMPLFVHHALAGDAHMAVTACLVWAVYFLLRWSQQGRYRDAFIAGLILGCIPALRYPDAIVAVAVVPFMLGHHRRIPRLRRHLLAAAGAAAIPILPLLTYNHFLLGAFWRTGYLLSNEQTAFAWSYFRAHAWQYLKQINTDGVGPMLSLGVIGIGVMLFRRPWRHLGLLLALLTVPMLLLYMAYYWADDIGFWTMRFLLPGFPAYLLAGIWALARIVRHIPPVARVVALVSIATVQLVWSVPEAIDRAHQIYSWNHYLSTVTQAIETTAAPGDVIIANWDIQQYLDFVRRWKLASTWAVRVVDRPATSRPATSGSQDDPSAPSVVQAAKKTALLSHYPGSRDQRAAKFAADVHAWAGGHRVFLVGSEKELQEMLHGAARSEDLHIIRRVTLPNVAPGLHPHDARGELPPGGELAIAEWDLRSRH